MRLPGNESFAQRLLLQRRMRRVVQIWRGYTEMTLYASMMLEMRNDKKRALAKAHKVFHEWVATVESKVAAGRVARVWAHRCAVLELAMVFQAWARAIKDTRKKAVGLQRMFLMHAMSAARVAFSEWRASIKRETRMHGILQRVSASQYQDETAYVLRAWRQTVREEKFRWRKVQRVSSSAGNSLKRACFRTWSDIVDATTGRGVEAIDEESPMEGAVAVRVPVARGGCGQEE